MSFCGGGGGGGGGVGGGALFTIFSIFVDRVMPFKYTTRPRKALRIFRYQQDIPLSKPIIYSNELDIWIKKDTKCLVLTG